MKVTLSRQNDMHFIARGDSGQPISLDGSAAEGRRRGARPMEAVLAALGGCSAIDVISILKKSRQTVTDCTIDITAERGDEVPAVFRNIHIHYRISGVGLEHKTVARAISLSADKYCSVSKMLECTAEITHSHEIISP